MTSPAAIKLTQVDDADYDGLPPKAFVVVGDIPGGEAGEVAWADVTGKPSVFPAAPTDWADVTGKPATFPAAAPTWAEVTGKPSTFAPAAHDHVVADVTGLQAIITDLTDRIEALESAAG